MKLPRPFDRPPFGDYRDGSGASEVEDTRSEPLATSAAVDWLALRAYLGSCVDGLGASINSAVDFGVVLRKYLLGSQRVWALVFIVETGLRNRIDAVMQARHQRLYGSASWLLDMRPDLPLLRTCIQQIQRDVVGKGQKASHSSVLNRLPLGFWCAMFARRYRGYLWPDLALAFPGVDRGSSDRVRIALQALRVSRNAIAHHALLTHSEIATAEATAFRLISFMAPDAVDAAHQLLADLSPDLR